MFRMLSIFFLTIIISNFSIADEIDSLQKLIDKSTDKKTSASLYFQLADSYDLKENPKDHYVALNEALRLSESINDKRGMGKANMKLGNYFYQNFELDFSFSHYNAALEIYRELDDQKVTADILFEVGYIYFNSSGYSNALNNANDAFEIYSLLNDKENVALTHSLLCDIFYYMGVNETAIDHGIQALQMFDELKLSDGKANLLNTIGNIYLDMDQYDKSEEYFNQALFLAKSEGDPYSIATSISNIGELFLQQKQFDEALQYFNRAIEIDKEERDDEGLGYSYFNIGNTYYLMGNYKASIEYLEMGRELSENSVDLELIATIDSQLGIVYSELGDYRKGIYYLKKGLATAQKINADPILQTCYTNLAKYYDKLGDQRNALIYLKLVLLHMEEMNRNLNSREIAQAEAIYNLSKKEQEIQLLRSENRIKDLEASEKTLMNIWLITSLILTLTIMIVVYRQYKEQNRMNHTLQVQKEEINLQKEEIQSQRDDIEKTNKSLNEKNKQITDSIEYAKRIQLSLLPDRSLLVENFSDYFILYLPRDIVSGDFYWITQLGNKICIAAVDCTGHGVPGAFMTVLANTLLNQIVLESKITCPHILVTTLDQKVRQNLNQHGITLSAFEGMDLSLCVIDMDSMNVRFTGANLPLYYIHDGKFDMLESDRFSIGGNMHNDKSFTIKTIQLEKGDSLFLATDGFQDQFGGKDMKKFMKLHFKNLIKTVSKLPIKQREDKLKEVFLEWMGDYPQTDDVLVVGVEI